MQPISVVKVRDVSGREANAARAMLQVFARRGVRVAFGIPGGLISSIFDALVDVPEIRLVMTRHEAMAAFCAIGHVVATGTPALVLTTSGPGITNAITGVAAAYLEELPLVLIGGEVSAAATSRGAMQDSSSNSVDAVALMRTVTRWSARVDSAAGAAGAAEQALRIATGPRPGPVFLSLPIDVGNARISRFPTMSLGDAAMGAVPDAALCAEVMQRLRRAKRPLIIAGNGARGAATELRALAERVASPVATTPHAKGVFPERHPLHLGVTGFGGHPSVQAYLASRPDVVCVVGSRLGDMATGAWNLPLTGSEATYQIDREPWLVGRNYPVTAGIVGDARVVLQAMLAAASPEPPPLREVTGIRRVADDAPAVPGLLRPAMVFAKLQEAFPDAFWAADQGEHCAYAIHYLQIDEPNQFRTMLGFVSMGTGIGLAIGARAAQQNRTVIGVCGDGGFAMHAGEVLTCVEHGIDVILVVINDGKWNMVNHGFASVYGRAPQELPSHVADLAGVAREFGAVGVRIEQPEDLDPERLRALASLKRPVVLDVRVDTSLSLSVQSRSASFKEFVGPK
ncbi:MAG TPA: thiamine pyrophosphate-binding protein [Polyangiaceae bacterium]|jgi:acetolactate synthase-1/2/3 large subunit|nr:thiamine pyrophosphate-binding protein [Polyangiaceae bacterium]